MMSNRPEHVTIRPGNEADARAVVRIWNDALPLVRQSQPYTTQDYRLLITVADLFVAERSDVIEGTVTLLDPARVEDSIARPGELEVTRLAVVARTHRHGIAWLLLACAQGAAVRRRARALVLWTKPEQVDTEALYRFLGYKLQAKRSSSNGETEERLVYRLSLLDGRRTAMPRNRDWVRSPGEPA